MISRFVDGFVLLLAMLVLAGYVMAWLDDRRAAHKPEDDHRRAA